MAKSISVAVGDIETTRAGVREMVTAPFGACSVTGNPPPEPVEPDPFRGVLVPHETAVDARTAASRTGRKILLLVAMSASFRAKDDHSLSRQVSWLPDPR